MDPRRLTVPKINTYKKLMLIHLSGNLAQMRYTIITGAFPTSQRDKGLAEGSVGSIISLF
jgi:hypothetical protein